MSTTIARPTHRASPQSVRRPAIIRSVAGLTPFMALLILWQVSGDPTSPYFPPPSTWLVALNALGVDGLLLPAIVATSATAVISLVASLILGIAVGMWVGASRVADRAMGPSFEFLRVLPAAVLVPVATLILGYTQEMKVAVVVLPTIWPILLGVRSARRGLSPVLVESSRMLGLSRPQRLAKIILPSLTTATFRGLAIAAPLALTITLLVEIVTRIDGIGALLGAAQNNFRSAEVFGLLIVTGALALVINSLLALVEWRLARRLPQTDRR